MPVRVVTIFPAARHDARRDVEEQGRHGHRRDVVAPGRLQAGDQAALMSLLAEDVRLVADGGGKVPGAAVHPVIGSMAVALFSLGVNRRFLPEVYQLESSEVNYQPAIIVRAEGQALVVLTMEVEQGRVKTIRFMANPEKLAHL